MHGPRAEEIRAKARQASNEARAAKVAQREQASEDAKLSLTQRIRRAAADSQEALVASLVNAAIADGSSRAMAELLNRVDGKVTDSLALSGHESLEAFTTEQLQAWLHTPAEAESAPLETL